MKNFISIAIIFLCSVATIYTELKEEDAQLNSVSKVDNNYVLRLKFEKRHGNFLMFYDFYGDVVFLQYRVDKWDYTYKKETKVLRRGVTYFLKFIYWGQLNSYPDAEESDVQNKIKEQQATARDRKPRKAFVGKYIQFKYAAPADIRF